MNKQLLAVIERAIRSELQIFPLNQSWEYLHQEYNIGRTQGKKLEVTRRIRKNCSHWLNMKQALILGKFQSLILLSNCP